MEEGRIGIKSGQEIMSAREKKGKRGLKIKGGVHISGF